MQSLTASHSSTRVLLNRRSFFQCFIFFRLLILFLILNISLNNHNRTENTKYLPLRFENSIIHQHVRCSPLCLRVASLDRGRSYVEVFAHICLYLDELLLAGDLSSQRLPGARPCCVKFANLLNVRHFDRVFERECLRPQGVPFREQIQVLRPLRLPLVIEDSAL